MGNGSLKKSDALRREKETCRDGPEERTPAGEKPAAARLIGPCSSETGMLSCTGRERTLQDKAGGAQDFLLFYSFKEWQP